MIYIWGTDNGKRGKKLQISNWKLQILRKIRAEEISGIRGTGNGIRKNLRSGDWAIVDLVI